MDIEGFIDIFANGIPFVEVTEIPKAFYYFSNGWNKKIYAAIIDKPGVVQIETRIIWERNPRF